MQLVLEDVHRCVCSCRILLATLLVSDSEKEATKKGGGRERRDSVHVGHFLPLSTDLHPTAMSPVTVSLADVQPPGPLSLIFRPKSALQQSEMIGNDCHQMGSLVEAAGQMKGPTETIVS